MNFDRSIFIGKFTQEAKELIEKVNTGLLQLEKEPANPSILKDIFRAVHTLKGSSKIVRFNNINLLSHKMEDLLMAAQDGKVSLTAALVDLLLRSSDELSQCVENILKGKGDSGEITGICQTLDGVVNGKDISQLLQREEDRALEAELHEVPETSLSIQNQPSLSEEIPGIPKIQETIRVGVDKLDNAVRLVGELSVSQRKSEHLVLILKELQRVARNHVKRVQQIFQTPHSDLWQELKTEILADGLQLLQGIESTFKEGRDDVATREIAISELYDDVLSMRMLPLSIIFTTFPRAVRDMSRYFHKDIELRITGEETTLDKKIIEKLNGPLIHILRNCIDHGIESPEERKARNKTATGLITMDAYHKGGHIKIEIRDDGQGIQREKLKERAIQRGLLSAEKAPTLSETELLHLVFLPRISTSDLITDISGRGVGMDIVKTNIEQLKGSIFISSTSGKGTTFVLTLPVTLTTLRCLIVSSQHTRFAIPINAIEETLQISEHELIEVIGHHAIRLRNQIIYIVHLTDVLGLTQTKNQLQEKYFVLITRTNGKRVGFIVDEILDEQDIVVKQLPPHMHKAKTIAGATISSDNTIMLILHIPEIVELAKHATIKVWEKPPVEAEVRSPRILVVEDSLNTGEIEKRILEAYGYQVDLAKDGVDALEHVEDVQYDLIVTDIEMPRMDGFTLTEKLRNMSTYTDIPIVIVTSLERESDKRRGLHVGANAYITKGNFEQRSLIETVKSLI